MERISQSTDSSMWRGGRVVAGWILIAQRQFFSDVLDVRPYVKMARSAIAFYLYNEAGHEDFGLGDQTNFRSGHRQPTTWRPTSHVAYCVTLLLTELLPKLISIRWCNILRDFIHEAILA